ncbi:bifunctional aldolase/short-chain dehydrogenase [Sorangium sp. So ce887]|uniref:bifunctional aldolase/short-chain dehydrogenase n=1 Tax=Sorangium sp. So ce887 TaxID=3133324 RepID=UPI003F63DD68
MDPRHSRDEAQRYLDTYAATCGEDLALRVYTSRLLGADPSLVLHGGGNTSVKSTAVDLLGDRVDVLFIKGSGWDLATIEPRGFPACRLAPLQRACELEAMTDEQMVALLRGQMLDPSSPTPSVEALLHAILPAKFVDHTHADAVLSVIDQPGSAEIVREIYGDQALFVPYVMPGFALARRVAELVRARLAQGALPSVMILDKHGVFTWGDTAEESYARMIDAVTRAERYIAQRSAIVPHPTVAAPDPEFRAAIGPVVRGALARASGRPWVCTLRTSLQLIAFCDRDDIARASQIGCATPDHVIRTKARPLIVDGGDVTDTARFRAAVEQAIARYVAEYHEYFRRSCAARGVARDELDPFPRVLLFPGVGALCVGGSHAEAAIVADVYDHTVSVIEAAEALGGYQPVPELDLFDMEYWSLEQAKLKLGAGQRGPLDRRIALVTGAASGIGHATAAAFLAAGAHVVLADRDEEPLEKAAAEFGGRHRGRCTKIACDVRSEASVNRAFAQAAAHFGGVDVVVSNAGRAFSGPIHTSEGHEALCASLELNLLGHQNVARAAARVLLAQDSGGALLFNASKSAFNQGPDFGPYSVAKAALVALMRQYAVDLGPQGIRANAVNADRIRTALFGAGLLEARARARNVSVDDYFRDNLLRRETTAADVAQAFVYLATAEATTGCVVTVDGGNAAAFPR